MASNPPSKTAEVDKHHVVGILPDHRGSRNGSDSAGCSFHGHSPAIPVVRQDLIADTLFASGAADSIPETECKKAIAPRVLLASDPLCCLSLQGVRKTAWLATTKTFVRADLSKRRHRICQRF